MQEILKHLVELRSHLIKALIPPLILFLGVVYWAPNIFKWFTQPLMQVLPPQAQSQMVFTDVIGTFFIPIKLTLLTCIVLTLPWILYQIWAFIAPGLYQNEKKLVLPLIASSYALFLGGIAFSYYFVCPALFHFIVAYNSRTGHAMMTDIGLYIDFLLNLFIAFGVVFEIPVVMVVLVYLGMVSAKQLKEWRPYAIVVNFIIAAILTPPDVLSQLMMAIPMCILYEVGLLISARIKK